MTKVIVSEYYSKTKKIIEQKHKSILDALSKMSDRTFIHLVQNLP